MVDIQTKWEEVNIRSEIKFERACPTTNIQDSFCPIQTGLFE